MTDNVETKQRLRLTFAKKESVKYIGHLDLMLAWERALRRARLPLAYSKGFNPRPKMQSASSLPLGCTGSAELLDIILDKTVDLSSAQAQIEQALPTGIQLRTIIQVPLKSPAMQQLLRQAEYQVIVETNLVPSEVKSRIEYLLSQDEVWQRRTRRKREEKFNLRPLLHALSLVKTTEIDIHLFMRVSTGQHGNLRPDHVLKELKLDDNWFTIERTKLLFEDNFLVQPSQ